MATTDIYALKVGTVTKSFADWGLEEPVFRHGVASMDTLSFQHASGIADDPKFDAFQQATLIDSEGKQRFVGRVDWWLEGNRMRYAVMGGDYWLKTTVSQQANVLVGGGFTLRKIGAMRVGNLIFGDQMSEIVAQVVADGGPITFGYANGASAPDDLSPEDLQRNLSAGEAIDRMLALSPQYDRRWNYYGTVGTPAKLEIVPVLRPGHGYEVGGVPLASNNTERTVTFGVAGGPERGAKFRARFDLLVPSVVVNFLGYEAKFLHGDGTVNGTSTGGAPVLAWKLTQQVAVATPGNGSFGTKTLYIPLRKGAFIGSGRAADEAVITDLATRLGAPYFQLWLDMSWSVMGEGCDFSIVPGELWKAENASLLYSSAGSFCREVVHDLAHGTTTVSCGAPSSVDFTGPWLAGRLRQLQNQDQASGWTAGFESQPGAESSVGESEVKIQVITDTNPAIAKQLIVKGTLGTMDHPRYTWDTVEGPGGITDEKVVILSAPV